MAQQKTIDLRNVLRDQTGRIASVESGDTGTFQHQTNPGTSQNVELAEMHPRQKIWYFAAQQMRPVTRGEIAKGLGYKKAPWLNDHIESLVTEGWLVKAALPHPGGLPRYVYVAVRPAK